MRRLVVASAIVLAGFAARAQDTGLPFAGTGHDANKPIAVSADSFIADLKNEKGVYSGNVVVTQGELKLRANEVHVLAPGGKPQRLEARGNVVFASPSGNAQSDIGVYDVPSRIVTLSGHVVLTKDQNVMRGQALEIKLASGEAKLISGKEAGERVQGLFTPSGNGKTGN